MQHAFMPSNDHHRRNMLTNVYHILADLGCNVLLKNIYYVNSRMNLNLCCFHFIENVNLASCVELKT